MILFLTRALGAHYVADTANKTVNKTDRNPCPGGADILVEEMDGKQTNHSNTWRMSDSCYGEKKAEKADWEGGPILH